MSDKFVQQSLTIPNNPFMTDSEVQQVIDTVLNMFVAPLSKWRRQKKWPVSTIGKATRKGPRRVRVFR